MHPSSSNESKSCEKYDSNIFTNEVEKWKPQLLLVIFRNKSLTFQKWSPDGHSAMSADGTVPIPPPPRWLTGVPRRYYK
ncbi:hypothetical protein CDAR_92131 [Caerostris darwini]|uniref:Uncharacterized protein n=1 Tax=Caerostris darwini TaxID=1538125 RepID=A0AAV4QP60_9ARAC|nr:hypothetical protein CDAR_92131 [Caerostris darwini]